jgi:hypothetical protein
LGSLGIGLNKGVATRQDVELAQARQEPETDAWGVPVERVPLPVPKATKGLPDDMTDKQYGLIKALFNYSVTEMRDYVDEFKKRNEIPADDKLTSWWASRLIEELKAAGYVPGKKSINPDQESKYN